MLFTSLLRVLAATRRVLALTYYKLEDILCTTYVGTGCLLLFWSTPVPWVDSWVARVETSERVDSLLQHIHPFCPENPKLRSDAVHRPATSDRIFFYLIYCYVLLCITIRLEVGVGENWICASPNLKSLE